MRRLIVIFISLYCFMSNAFSGVLVQHVQCATNPYRFGIGYHLMSKTISSPIHTESDGENDVLQNITSFSIKINNYNNKKLLDCSVNEAYLNLLGFGKFSSYGNTSFQAINKRILIFPFHSFW